MAGSDVLKEIVAKKKERIAAAKFTLPLEELKERAAGMSPARPFIKAVSKRGAISLIAEIKQASPSCGRIRRDFNHLDIARVYQEAGVQAISVLTEEDFFRGSLSYLADVRQTASLPLLRKDFIIDEYQMYESRVSGADAVLLIADLLPRDALAGLMGIAAQLGLECLVEVHTEKELKKAVNLKAPLIGINSRDLHTLEINPKTTEQLFPLVPKDRIVVVESGIRSRQDVLFFKILGVHAVLIGQAFMEAADIRAKIAEMMEW